MATTSRMPTPEPVPAEQGLVLLDRQARERLGMSGEEFLARWDAGAYAGAEHDEPDVVKVAMLIPLTR